MSDPTYGERLETALATLIAELRKEKGMTLDALADLAGAHRTSVGKIERDERGVTIAMAAQLAKALRQNLSDLIRHAEEVVDPRSPRIPSESAFLNEEALHTHTGLRNKQLAKSIASCYATMDVIDAELIRRGESRIAKLVELANLSSMVGNFLGAGIADASRGRYKRNKPHAYPDLLPCEAGAQGIELKMALEDNRPKGHLAKSGCHMTVRYVLANATGHYARGKEKRGDLVRIWEIRVGMLDKDKDFDISNTEGDSGKTATIKTDTLWNMPVVYLDREAIPYAKTDRYYSMSGIRDDE